MYEMKGHCEKEFLLKCHRICTIIKTMCGRRYEPVVPKRVPRIEGSEIFRYCVKVCIEIKLMQPFENIHFHKPYELIYITDLDEYSTFFLRGTKFCFAGGRRTGTFSH